MSPDLPDAHHKDETLDRLAQDWNVAQFVSFDPALAQRFVRIRGFERNHRFASAGDAIGALLRSSPDRSVNIRTFHPHRSKSRDFVYGLRSEVEVVDSVRAFGASGLTTIVNETVDINDGGVSGVFLGDAVEFAPADTPRCVEKPGTAALPRSLARGLFETIYGFVPAVPDDPAQRVEFSIHPVRRGYRHDHTIVWELESVPAALPTAPRVRWPHRFSRFVGDKAFGLLIGALVGLPVPRTFVVPRKLAPFAFGEGGIAEPWIRTCPVEPVPGRFTTRRGWVDPFELMHREDPEGGVIASVLCQRGIDAVASGAAVTQADGTPLVEGVSGFGDAFMVGERRPEPLPRDVAQRVAAAYTRIVGLLGAARFEWVDDGRQTWIVQLHCGISASSGSTIVPGEPPRFRRFRVEDGLESLRALIEDALAAGDGIVLVGAVGVTSHFGDVLRRAGVPSRVETL